MANIR